MTKIRWRLGTWMVCFCLLGHAQQTSQAALWTADRGDGSYKNPILYADYSDPDMIRVGDDYYMTASSFNCVPGLPILHSKDLVNWTVVNYALADLHLDGVAPPDFYDKPQHGKGVWAPCIRYHGGEYMIYWGDPDFGIYVVKTRDVLGKWDKPVLVLPGRGMIDPTPLFDDDGKVYLAHAWAGSRANMNSVITLCELDGTGTKPVGEETLIYDGNDGVNHTVEGGKLYKKDGYYYLLAPAGGVTNGWQIVLRSKSIYGPYDVKTVLAQGNSTVNGPHQGGLVQTQAGEWWFLHFQDKGAYGRITHLQPVAWQDGWPVMGQHAKSYCGEPVELFRKPNVGKAYPPQALAESDEFNSPRLGLQWQWHANPKPLWGFPSQNGYYRMYGQYAGENHVNLWDVPSLLLQKFTGPAFTATVKVTGVLLNDGDQIGLLVMGRDYSYVSVQKAGAGYALQQAVCNEAEKAAPEILSDKLLLKNLVVNKRMNYQTAIDNVLFYLRVSVADGAYCSFSYSVDGVKFIPFGQRFKARAGKWIGAKMGLFVLEKEKDMQRSWADFDWFRVEHGN